MFVKVSKYLGFAAFSVAVLTGCVAEGDLPKVDNQVPFANAGQDLQVTVGATVELTGAASVDPDGDELTYRWTLTPPTGSAATLGSPNLVETSFGADTSGEYRVTLVVNDGQMDSAIDSLLVTAVVGSGNNGENRPPVADAGIDLNVQTGLAVTLDASNSTDPDGDSLTFAWTMEGKPLGSTAELDDAVAARPRFAPDKDGEYEISLIVSDGTVESVPSTVFVRAFSDNTPPLANAGSDQVVATGSRVDLDGTTSVDADGDTLSFIWSMTQSPADSTATLSAQDVANPGFTADKDGEYVISLVVNDGTIDSTPSTVTVTATDANVPPIAHAGLDQNVAVGAEVTLDGSLTADANDDSMTYAWSLTTVPSGSSAMLANATSLSPRFTADVEGSYIAQLIANDGVLDSAPNTVTIVATLNNVAPVADAGTDITSVTGMQVQLSGAGSTDGDNDSLTFTWSIVAAPTGSNATLSSTTSEMPTFTPDVDGTYVFQLIANDGNVDSVPDSVVLTSATPANPAPSVEGDIIITEMMVNPETLVDTVGEWFEIHNPSATQTWDLQGCTIEDLGVDSHTITGTLEIGPGDYLTLARNVNIGFSPGYVYSGISLANTEDELLILCNNGTDEVSNVAWGTALGPNFTIPAGSSLELMTSMYDETSNDDGINWCAASTSYNGDNGSPNAAGTATTTCP